MSHIGIRDLRNHTADVVRRVQDGEVLTVTSRGVPVARLGPVAPEQRQPLRRLDLVGRLAQFQADAALRDELRALDGTTDDLGPLR